MEYLISTVLVMTAAIAASAGDERDGIYENNYIGNSDVGYNGHSQQGKDFYAEPHYAFAYEVHDDHTGDIKSHKEERKGDHTQGMYMLVEPNGSKRIVEYVVQGKSGFNAKVHQSKPQGGHGGYAGGHSGQGGYTGHSGYSGHTGGHSGHSSYTGGHSGQSGYPGGHSGQSGYNGGHSSHGSYSGGQTIHGGYTGGHSGQSGYPGEQPSHNSYTPGNSASSGYTGEDSATSGYSSGPSPSYTSQSTSLGDYASGHYSYNQPPYKVQEDSPSYNYKPHFKPSFNLQPFKPLIPYTPSDPQHSKNTFPNAKPLTALYRPQTSYKSLTSNKNVIFKLIPVRKQGSYNKAQGNHGHATSSVSFLSHGSKIASTTNHVIPQQRKYENKH